MSLPRDKWTAARAAKIYDVGVDVTGVHVPDCFRRVYASHVPAQTSFAKKSKKKQPQDAKKPTQKARNTSLNSNAPPQAAVLAATGQAESQESSVASDEERDDLSGLPPGYFPPTMETMPDSAALEAEILEQEKATNLIREAVNNDLPFDQQLKNCAVILRKHNAKLSKMRKNADGDEVDSKKSKVSTDADAEHVEGDKPIEEPISAVEVSNEVESKKVEASNDVEAKDDEPTISAADAVLRIVTQDRIGLAPVQVFNTSDKNLASYKINKSQFDIIRDDSYNVFSMHKTDLYLIYEFYLSNVDGAENVSPQTSRLLKSVIIYILLKHQLKDTQYKIIRNNTGKNTPVLLLLKKDLCPQVVVNTMGVQHYVSPLKWWLTEEEAAVAITIALNASASRIKSFNPMQVELLLLMGHKRCPLCSVQLIRPDRNACGVCA